MFPPGWPGLALLLLRASVAGALLFEQYARHGFLSTWSTCVAVVISLALSVGYFTPIAAALGALLHVLTWFYAESTTPAAMIIGLLDAGALALLGPGAYSLDAQRFGRRLLLPPAP